MGECWNGKTGTATIMLLGGCSLQRRAGEGLRGMASHAHSGFAAAGWGVQHHDQAEGARCMTKASHTSCRAPLLHPSGKAFLRGEIHSRAEGSRCKRHAATEGSRCHSARSSAMQIPDCKHISWDADAFGLLLSPPCIPCIATDASSPSGAATGPHTWRPACRRHLHPWLPLLRCQHSSPASPTRRNGAREHCQGAHLLSQGHCLTGTSALTSFNPACRCCRCLCQACCWLHDQGRRLVSILHLMGYDHAVDSCY